MGARIAVGEDDDVLFTIKHDSVLRTAILSRSFLHIARAKTNKMIGMTEWHIPFKSAADNSAVQ